MNAKMRGVVTLVAACVLLVGAAPAALAGKPANQPTVLFSKGGYGVNENVSPAQITVARNPKGSSTVHFATAGGSATGGASCATAGVDYVTVPDALVTFSNQATVNTPVTVCNDTPDEPNETVVLQLTNPSSGTSLTNKSQATLTINDNDPAPSLSINDRSANEGDAALFTVSASAPSGQPLSVHWSTVNGTATVADGDYNTQSGSVAIPPGGTSTTFSVATNEDSVDEDDESFTVSLSSPVNASIADGSGVFTIEDDDTATPDTTAPTSTSATIADNDDDSQFSVGDVFTIVFDEPMNTAASSDGTDYLEYNISESLHVGEGDFVWLNSTTLEVTIVSTSLCPSVGCELGGYLSALSANFIEDSAGNDWALGGDVTLEDPSPADRTAPTATSATIADNDDDGLFSVGDVFTIVFDEPMNIAARPDPIDYSYGEILRDDEATFVWLNATTLQVTIASLSLCQVGSEQCPLGGTIFPGFGAVIEDLAGNDWTGAGDNTLEDPSPPDTTAPRAASTTIVDNGDGGLSPGDVITIRFDEPMNTAAIDTSEGITYDGGELIEAVTEATYVYLDSMTLQITVNSISYCSHSSCPLGGDISLVSPDSIEDAAGNDWALGGDVTL